MGFHASQLAYRQLIYAVENLFREGQANQRSYRCLFHRGVDVPPARLAVGASTFLSHATPQHARFSDRLLTFVNLSQPTR
jgi:hypothetical protein